MGNLHPSGEGVFQPSGVPARNLALVNRCLANPNSERGCAAEVIIIIVILIIMVILILILIHVYIYIYTNTYIYIYI